MLGFSGKKGLSSAFVGLIIIGLTAVFVLQFNPTAGKKLGGLTEECAARVKGTCIEPKAHKAAYRLIFSQGSGGLSQTAASHVALEGLIERELLIQEAERLGLSIGDEEVTDNLFLGLVRVSIPAVNVRLQNDLRIDDGRLHVSFQDPKTKIFDMKIYERLVRQLTGRSTSEFRTWQGREFLAAKMRDLVRAPVRIADGEAFDRFATERSTAKIDYVVVRRSWVEKYAVATELKDLDAWAKDPANASKIVVPVRHILVKFPDDAEGAKPEDKEAAKGVAKKKAEEILARVKKGEDFAKLAGEFSEDPGSKDKGGMYPGEDVAHFVEPFKKAVASVKPGELVPDLVETQYGYHIIRRDPATKDDVRKAYAEGRVAELSKAIAAKIAGDLKAGTSGEDAVKAAIAAYGTFTPKAPKVAAAEGDAGAAEPAPTYTASTDPERPQFLTSSDFTHVGTPIPGVSGAASENVVAFAFDGKPKDVSEPIASDDGFLVAQLESQKPATREEFDKNRGEYEAGLVAAKQAEALALYVKRLRDREKDEIKVVDQNVFGNKGDAGAEEQGEEDDEGP